MVSFICLVDTKGLWLLCLLKHYHCMQKQIGGFNHRGVTLELDFWC